MVDSSRYGTYVNDKKAMRPAEEHFYDVCVTWLKACDMMCFRRGGPAQDRIQSSQLA